MVVSASTFMLISGLKLIALTLLISGKSFGVGLTILSPLDKKSIPILLNRPTPKSTVLDPPVPKIFTFCTISLNEAEFISKVSFVGKIIGELLKNFNGKSYFLGGQYKARDEKLFTNIFECGEAGLSDPKGTLKIATNNLIKELR